jgi:dTMP kinase
VAAGRLIVLEGPEGAGKTTQIRLLAERLSAAGVPHVAVREPGGTHLGDEIRRLLLHRDAGMHARAEALLFMASRAELVQEVVKPALADGKVVLMDRFFLSTYAYQIEGRGLPEREVREANRLATDGLTPDLTIILRLGAGEGLERARRRGAVDRIERSGTGFHERVAAFFERLAAGPAARDFPECGEIAIVDARGASEQVFRDVSRLLARQWPETFPEWPESHH